MILYKKLLKRYLGMQFGVDFSTSQDEKNFMGKSLAFPEAPLEDVAPSLCPKGPFPMPVSAIYTN